LTPQDAKDHVHVIVEEEQDHHAAGGGSWSWMMIRMMAMMLLSYHLAILLQIQKSRMTMIWMQRIMFNGWRGEEQQRAASSRTEIMDHELPIMGWRDPFGGKRVQKISGMEAEDFLRRSRFYVGDF
jgi:hypothetical protein